MRNGFRVRVRPLGADDGERLHRLFHRLSPDSVYRRFMSPIPHPTPALAAALLDVDHRDREALAVEVAGELVGVARYFRSPARPEVAEIAIVVEDSWQGHGVGHALMERLAAVARRRGIRQFSATLLGDNRPAARLLVDYSPQARFSIATGALEAVVPLRRPCPAAPRA